MDLIDELSLKLESLDDYSGLYHEDQRLQIAAHTLYTNLLVAVEGIILYLTGNKYSRSRARRGVSFVAANGL